MDDLCYAAGPHGTLAYRVVGTGPELVAVPNWATNIEAVWSTPELREWFDRAARSFRILTFDQRGTGLSDRGRIPRDLDEWIDDLAAVIDAAGFERPILFGADFSVPLAIAFAARRPGRIRALTLYGGYSRLVDVDGSGVGVPPADGDASAAMLIQGWGRSDSLFAHLGAPGKQRTRDRDTVARVQRLALNPGEVRQLVPTMFGVDVTAELARATVPALILHRAGDALVTRDHARFMAERLPQAQLRGLPGTDHYMFLGDWERIIEELELFAGAEPGGRREASEVAVVWFSDIAASTETAGRVGAETWRRRLDQHDEMVGHYLHRHGGTLVKHLGDGVLATFASAVAAVRCATRFSERASSEGLAVRIGIHVGEVTRRPGGELTGLALHVAQRVQAAADPGDVVVTSTVRELMLDSTLGFAAAGTHHLKGLDGPVTLYRALSA